MKQRKKEFSSYAVDSLGRSILNVLLWCILVPVGGNMLFMYFFAGQKMLHEPLHALVEGFGSAIAVAILFLIQSEKGLLKHTQIRNIWIICALIAMSIFDGFHAGMKPGNLFVWLHTLAVLSGGVFFALTWTSKYLTSRLSFVPILVACLVVAISLVSLFFPDVVPSMVQSGKFTDLSKTLNMLGGVCFVIASAYFITNFMTSRQRNDMLLGCHCLLFGVSGLLFKFSDPWDLGWWYWHIVRLGAYMVLVHFFYQTFRDREMEIKNLNHELLMANMNLEDKVKQRADVIQKQQQALMVSSKMSALGEMAGGIAHEINNPLAVIKSLSNQLQEVIDDSTLDKPLIKEMASQMEGTTNRIAKIVYGLRTFSRDGGQDPFCTVNVHQLIEETLSLCSERFKKHDTKIIIEDLKKDFCFEGRSIEISQVLLNLLNNAFDAISGFKEKWIKITTLDRQNWIEIQVTDCGSGIPFEHREKIFQPFFTTKDVGKGTGMGLSISAGIMQKHHGELILDSQCPNTRFVIRLPKKQPAALAG